jgi:hypothetical protein
MDKIGQGSTASWQFFNVSVEGYMPPDCFAAAVTQVRQPRALLMLVGMRISWGLSIFWQA